MRRRIPIGFLAITCLVTAAQAGDGHVPVWDASVIDDGGVYLLIRDVSATTGPAIRVVSAAEHVVIDLNGFSVGAGSDPAIDVQGSKSVVIRNGIVESGGDGIVADKVERLVIEEVFVNSGRYGLYLLDARDFVVRNSVIEASDYGALIFADAFAIQGTIADNSFRTTGFRTIFVDDSSPDPDDVSTVHVQRNQIRGAGVEIEYSYGSLITGNSIYAPDSSNALLLDNTSRSTVSDNVVRGSFYGISVRPSGDYNLVQNNQITGGSYGLRFEGNYNVYRDNMIRDYSTAPVLDSGAGNTNAGGNVF